MGISSDGLLIFGINMYGEDDDDLPQELRKFIVTRDDDFDFDEFICKEAGLPEWEPNMSEEALSLFFDKRRKAVESYPVTFEIHCSYDFPMYILSIPETRISSGRGHPLKINTSELIVSDNKIQKMKEWCKLHDIKWQEPQWFLASLYG